MNARANLGALLSCLVVFLSVPTAGADSLRGEVSSMDTIIARDIRTNAVMTCELKPSGFTRWDERGVVVLSGADLSGCGFQGPVMFEKPVTMKVNVSGSTYTVTIPANRTVLYPGKDGIQIDVKNDSTGSIGVDLGASTRQRDAIFNGYQRGEATNQAVENHLAELVRKKDYGKARDVYSRLVNGNELRAHDIAELNEIFATVPAADRPIRTYADDSRWTMNEMTKTFGGENFDKMTQQEFIVFARRWAANPNFNGNVRKGDETYLFRFFDSVGIPPETQNQIYVQAFNTRFDKILDAYRKNRNRNDIPFKDRYNADTAYAYLLDSPGGEAFIKEIDQKIAALPPPEQAFIRAQLNALNEPSDKVDKSSGNIYVYRLEVSGAQGDENFRGSGSKIAEFLRRNGYSDSCVDMRQAGLSAQGRFVAHESFNLVMNWPIRKVDLDNLRKEICRNAPATEPWGKPSTCKVKFRTRKEKIADLAIAAYPEARGNGSGTPLIKPLGTATSLPRFGEACKTGKHSDSWNNAASTPEARKLLSDLGIDVNQARTLSLVDAKEQNELYMFGFPRHDLGSGGGLSTGGAAQPR